MANSLPHMFSNTPLFMEHPLAKHTMFYCVARVDGVPILRAFGIKNRVRRRCQKPAGSSARRSGSAGRSICPRRRGVIRRIVHPDFEKPTPTLRALVTVAAMQPV